MEYRTNPEEICACGSHQPALSCCQPWEEALRGLVQHLAAFALTAAESAASRQAARTYWNTRQERATQGTDPGFLEWVLFDHAAPGALPPVARWADTVSPALTDPQRWLLFWLLLTAPGVYQVTDRPTGRQIIAKDLLTGAEHLLGPFGLPHRLITTDLFVARIIPLGGVRRAALSMLIMPGRSSSELVAFLRAAAQLAGAEGRRSLEDFVASNPLAAHAYFNQAHRSRSGAAVWTVRWAPYEDCRATYRGSAPGPILAALDRMADLRREPAAEGPPRFRWIASGTGVAAGWVVAAGDTVLLRTDTVEDLQAARRSLEARLGPLVGLVAEPVHEAVGHGPDPTESDGSKAPEGVTFLRSMFARWADTPSGALGQHTPRAGAMARRKAETVRAQLHQIEAGLLRWQQAGHAVLDPGTLWAELHLSRPIRHSEGGTRSVRKRRQESRPRPRNLPSGRWREPVAGR